MNGILYLVATPIGNLEDITLRGINVLKNVDIIAAEDTRHTLKLLNHLNISKPLISYYKENENVKTEILIKKLLDGENIALVSDAGTPGISDPGEEIVKEAIKNNIKIVPIPGACAAINAVIGSGFSTKEFLFVGFLPNNKKEKKEKLRELKEINKTIILYEAPHRLNKTLEDLKDSFGDVEVSIAREITKIHEEFIREKISKIMENNVNTKGEFVIVINNNMEIKHTKIQEILNNLSLEEHYEYYKKQNYEKKEIIKLIAKDRNKNKNEIYQYFLKAE